MITANKFKPTQVIQGDNNNKMLIFHRINQDDLNLQQLINKEKLEVIEDEIEFGYDNLTMSEALKLLVTSMQKLGQHTELQEKDIPSGFETVGDVAHMNLNQH